MEDLIEAWLHSRAAWTASALAGEPARKQNRLADRVWELSRRIAVDPALRPTIIGLCASDMDPDTRLGAALVRERWNIGGATLTLVDIVEKSGAVLPRPATMMGALAGDTTRSARSAALCVYNIDRGTGNTVGERLA